MEPRNAVAEGERRKGDRISMERERKREQERKESSVPSERSDLVEGSQQRGRARDREREIEREMEEFENGDVEIGITISNSQSSKAFLSFENFRLLDF